MKTQAPTVIERIGAEMRQAIAEVREAAAAIGRLSVDTSAPAGEAGPARRGAASWKGRVP